MLYEFPEFLPDLPAYKNPGMIEAENVIPAGNSYQQAQSLVSISDAIDSYARGVLAASAPDGTSANFVGNTTKLYRLIDNQWTDVTRTLSAYATAAEEIWSMTQFGNHVIATNYSDEIQTVDLSAAATTKFANLSGSAVPQAKYITTVKDFVMVANIVSYPFRVQWSGIGDHTNWPTGGASTTTQAGLQDLDSQYGYINAIVGGEYAVVFQERAITRLEYVGSPVVFSFSTQEINQGTKYPNSVVKVGDSIFYIGLDGFYVFDGHRSHSIGVNKVDKTFMSWIDETRPDRVSVAVDYNRHLICWAVPTSDSINAFPNKLFFYNYSPNSKNRWSYVDLDVDRVISTRSQGYTMDGLDAYCVANGLTYNNTASGTAVADLNLLTPSLDSKYWMGGKLEFAAFAPENQLSPSVSASTSSTLKLFSGSALPAKLETAETQLTQGQRTELNLVKPIVTGNGDASISGLPTTVTMQIGSRDLVSNETVFGAELPVDDIGQVPCRSNARYHRLRVNIKNGFRDAIGVEILEANPGGYR